MSRHAHSCAAPAQEWKGEISFEFRCPHGHVDKARLDYLEFLTELCHGEPPLMMMMSQQIRTAVDRIVKRAKAKSPPSTSPAVATTSASHLSFAHPGGGASAADVWRHIDSQPLEVGVRVISKHDPTLWFHYANLVRAMVQEIRAPTCPFPAVFAGFPDEALGATFAACIGGGVSRLAAAEQAQSDEGQQYGV